MSKMSKTHKEIYISNRNDCAVHIYFISVPYFVTIYICFMYILYFFSPPIVLILVYKRPLSVHKKKCDLV